MQIFYSKSTNGFYESAIHGENIPADAVEITKEQRKNLLQGQAEGKKIKADKDGVPQLEDTVASLAELKKAKTAEINAAFNDELQAGITTAKGIKLKTDKATIQNLKFDYDMAFIANMTVLSVEDIDENNHADQPLADVLNMIKELSGHYQTLLAKKQNLRGLIKNAKKNELDTITWS